MIYEIVNENLRSLATQWSNLAQAIDRLADALPGDPRLAFLDNDVLPAVNPARGLQQRCEDERDRIEAEIDDSVPLPAGIPLFQDAAEIFRDSDAELRINNVVLARNSVQNIFDVNFPELDTDTVEITMCRAQFRRVASFIRLGLQEFEEILSPAGQPFHIKGIRGSVDNLTSYPLLTSDFSIGSSSTGTSGAVSGGGSFQRVIDAALREVLGRLPKASDTRSFQTALSQSFQITEVGGHTEFKWTPRSYAGQTDLGGSVSGAQASLATRGRVALENSLPLLDGLYPLLPDADPQEVEAARAIVRSEFTEIVNELGVEGGPRVQRVNTLFNLLRRQATTGIDGAIIEEGKLGYLQSVFGLNDGQVNTLEEEVNVTNFVVLQDYVSSLEASWTNFRDERFGRDLGTRLVLLSRALSVASESVNEIYAAMDSVFVGSAERQVASFTLEGGGTMLVEELLSWVVTFTSDEAPKLVYEGGRRGVEAILPTAEQLDDLVGQFVAALASDPSLPQGLRHPRVRYPLMELRTYLQQIQQLAQDVRTPV